MAEEHEEQETLDALAVLTNNLARFQWLISQGWPANDAAELLHLLGYTKEDEWNRS